MKAADRVAVLAVTIAAPGLQGHWNVARQARAALRMVERDLHKALKTAALYGCHLVEDKRQGSPPPQDVLDHMREALPYVDDLAPVLAEAEQGGVYLRSINPGD